MMKGRIKKILYVCSVVVLFLLGFYIWKMNIGIHEGQTFTVEGEQEATFIMETKLEHPRMIAVRVDGEMEGNGTLVLKGHGREEDVRVRRTLPVKWDELGDDTFESRWDDSRVEIEFSAPGCVVKRLEITVEISE